MNSSVSRAEKMFRKKFACFEKLVVEMGDRDAWEAMLEDYPERQRKSMGPLIENTTLADGFAKAIPLFKQMGMEMEIINISTQYRDAVLEIQRTCPVLTLCQEYGFAKPCHIICEMDVEATRRAFPGMQGEILSRQADGDCVCVFKYERNRQV